MNFEAIMSQMQQCPEEIAALTRRMRDLASRSPLAIEVCFVSPTHRHTFTIGMVAGYLVAQQEAKE